MLSIKVLGKGVNICGCNTQGTEPCFPVVLFVMLYKVVLTLESMDEISSVTIQMKAFRSYLPVVLFIVLY